eukprot:5049324-Prymnesium_polylepis.1
MLCPNGSASCSGRPARRSFRLLPKTMTTRRSALTWFANASARTPPPRRRPHSRLGGPLPAAP